MAAPDGQALARALLEITAADHGPARVRGRSRRGALERNHDALDLGAAKADGLVGETSSGYHIRMTKELLKGVLYALACGFGPAGNGPV